jgi:transposase
MTLKQLSRLDVIGRAERREITQKAAAKMLRVTDRTVREYLQRLEQEGPGFLQHGLKGRPSNNRIPEKEREKIESLLQNKYPDFGPTFAAEKLRELHGIKRDRKTVLAIQVSLGLQKPRRTKKKAAHRACRTPRPTYGELVQFDGSYHVWLETRLLDGDGNPVELCLLLAIDDATGRILDAQFAPHEGVLPVMGFWLSYAGMHGLPKSIYLDRFSTYSMNHRLAKENPDTLTQFERAAKEAGVEIVHSHCPQGKGRVERVFGTLQDRLVKEMRLAGISTVEDANTFLRETYIPDFNLRFGREAAKRGDLHRRVSRKEITDVLPYVFCRREQRVIQNDFTIPFKKERFQLLPTPRLHMRPKEKVDVHQLPDGDFRLLVRGKKANYHLLPPTAR